MSLRRALATPDAKRRYVRHLFASIADRYDLITIVLSFDRDRRWKAKLVSLAEPWPGDALDLACGTGDLTFQLAQRGRRVVGLDITPRMVELARQKRGLSPFLPAPRFRRKRGPPQKRGQAPFLDPAFLVGDMMALPFPDRAFHLVTAGYGLRNVPVIEPALDEIYRVLRPGGRFLSLDFDRPEHPAVRAVYLAYLTVVGSITGLLLHGDADTYRYIPESIRRYPGSRGVTELMQRAGFRDVGHVPVFGGLMAINGGSR